MPFVNQLGHHIANPRTELETMPAKTEGVKQPRDLGASGLNRTLGTRPRPSSQLAEERRGPARLQTFGRSREGGERKLRLTGVGPSRQIRRIFSYRTFLKVFDLPVKLHPMMFRPLEYR
jgi:hypothetical protein